MKKNTEIHLSNYKFSKPFNFVKTSNVLTELWLFFHSVWCFLPKKESLPANAAVKSKLYKACQCNVVQKTPDNIAHDKLYAMLSQRLQTTWHTKNPGNAVWTTSGVSIYIYYILGLSHQKNCHYLID